MSGKPGGQEEQNNQQQKTGVVLRSGKQAKGPMPLQKNQQQQKHRLQAQVPTLVKRLKTQHQNHQER
jgi:hypothetical protein